MRCILSEYRTDKCANCTPYCQYRIAMSGLDGNGGRVASANIPADYRDVTLTNSPVRASQTDIYALLDKYVGTFGGEGRVKSLYLWSESPGTGKTTTACALINAWISRDYLGALKDGKQPRQRSAYFLDINQLQTEYNLATMTDNKDELEAVKKRMKIAMEAPFLVVDDVGIRKATDSFKSIVHAVINKRTTDKLPTIYTSNLPIEEMAKVFDDRLQDRMRDMCGVIEFKGVSKRGRR